MHVNNIQFAFPKGMEVGWYNLQTPVDPFGTRWGKGLVHRDSEGYFVTIGNYSSTHAELKKYTIDHPTIKSFYYGILNHVLYMEAGLIGVDIPFTSQIVNEVLFNLKVTYRRETSAIPKEY